MASSQPSVRVCLKTLFPSRPSALADLLHAEATSPFSLALSGTNLISVWRSQEATWVQQQQFQQPGGPIPTPAAGFTSMPKSLRRNPNTQDQSANQSTWAPLASVHSCTTMTLNKLKAHSRAYKRTEREISLPLLQFCGMFWGNYFLLRTLSTVVLLLFLTKLLENRCKSSVAFKEIVGVLL